MSLQIFIVSSRNSACMLDSNALKKVCRLNSSIFNGFDNIDYAFRVGDEVKSKLDKLH